VQCILNVSHGIAPGRPDFFRLAFGEGVRKFLRIIQMPENYIINRSRYAGNGAIRDWEEVYLSMSPSERRMARRLIAGGKGTVDFSRANGRLGRFLCHYENEQEW